MIAATHSQGKGEIQEPVGGEGRREERLEGGRERGRKGGRERMKERKADLTYVMNYKL